MEHKKEYRLHEPSEEQKDILKYLEDFNVKVQAVAGSGKTTTALHIARKFNDKDILLLTYNRKLMDETLEKTKSLRIKNLEVRTFHSFGQTFFKVPCAKDKGIRKIIAEKISNKVPINYDLILVDEAQDITPILYEFTCKIISQNLKTPKLCILGDKNQAIYEYKDADSRYLEKAEELFKFNDLKWKNCILSESFRVNKGTVDFINNVFYDTNIMKSNIKKPYSVNYIVCNTFGSNELVNKIIECINEYGIENVFVLAFSVKSEKAPAKKLANMLSSRGVLVYVPSNDETPLNAKEYDNKLIFSTFHQSKGLERKIVFVVGFDLSFFKLASCKWSATNQLRKELICCTSLTRCQLIKC
ncbi:UvrD-helicase domain-containing protein [Spiroplasma endosymbiont of Stenodema calcarata]|uniref:UvrD-helicase domain-containing protein n=1 Tax=Spiroplasma endosymbiont of Stenodema calcarata TaxID=3139328 RepID=UPI003CCAD826